MTPSAYPSSRLPELCLAIRQDSLQTHREKARGAPKEEALPAMLLPLVESREGIVSSHTVVHDKLQLLHIRTQGN